MAFSMPAAYAFSLSSRLDISKMFAFKTAVNTVLIQEKLDTQNGVLRTLHDAIEVERMLELQLMI